MPIFELLIQTGKLGEYGANFQSDFIELLFLLSYYSQPIPLIFKGRLIWDPKPICKLRENTN